MTLRSTSVHDGSPIDPAFAMGAPDGVAAGNRSPHLAWEGVPEGTRSFAVFCVDPDAPASREDVGVEGKTVAADRPRADFVHWVLFDIPADVREIAEGADSDGVTVGGKAAEERPVGTRGGNSYTGWFEGDAAMAGSYNGYDGPHPPFNDARVHRYVFTVVALGTDTLGRGAGASREAVDAAIQGHDLARASITGTYTLNPDLRG